MVRRVWSQHTTLTITCLLQPGSTPPTNTPGHIEIIDINTFSVRDTENNNETVRLMSSLSSYQAPPPPLPYTGQGSRESLDDNDREVRAMFHRDTLLARIVRCDNNDREKQAIKSNLGRL